jgi:hypothetical protein
LVQHACPCQVCVVPSLHLHRSHNQGLQNGST